MVDLIPAASEAQMHHGKKPVSNFFIGSSFISGVAVLPDVHVCLLISLRLFSKYVVAKVVLF